MCRYLLIFALVVATASFCTASPTTPAEPQGVTFFEPDQEELRTTLDDGEVSAEPENEFFTTSSVFDGPASIDSEFIVDDPVAQETDFDGVTNLEADQIDSEKVSQTDTVDPTISVFPVNTELEEPVEGIDSSVNEIFTPENVLPDNVILENTEGGLEPLVDVIDEEQTLNDNIANIGIDDKLKENDFTLNEIFDGINGNPENIQPDGSIISNTGLKPDNGGIFQVELASEDELITNEPLSMDDQIVQVDISNSNETKATISSLNITQSTSPASSVNKTKEEAENTQSYPVIVKYQPETHVKVIGNIDGTILKDDASNFNSVPDYQPDFESYDYGIHDPNYYYDTGMGTSFDNPNDYADNMDYSDFSDYFHDPSLSAGHPMSYDNYDSLDNGFGNSFDEVLPRSIPESQSNLAAAVINIEGPIIDLRKTFRGMNASKEPTEQIISTDIIPGNQTENPEVPTVQQIADDIEQEIDYFDMTTLPNFPSSSQTIDNFPETPGMEPANESGISLISEVPLDLIPPNEDDSTIPNTELPNNFVPDLGMSSNPDEQTSVSLIGGDETQTHPFSFLGSLKPQKIVVIQFDLNNDDAFINNQQYKIKNPNNIISFIGRILQGIQTLKPATSSDSEKFAGLPIDFLPLTSSEPNYGNFGSEHHHFIPDFSADNYGVPPFDVASSSSDLDFPTTNPFLAHLKQNMLINRLNTIEKLFGYNEPSEMYDDTMDPFYNDRYERNVPFYPSQVENEVPFFSSRFVRHAPSFDYYDDYNYPY